MNKLKSFFFVVLSFFLLPFPSRALTINVDYGPGISAGSEMAQAFDVAAFVWESLLQDDVEVNISLSVGERDPGVLGTAVPTVLTGPGTYGLVTGALAFDATSGFDNLAVASLPASEIDFLINNADGSIRLDNDGSANNTEIFATSANLKALGFALPQIASDGDIVFSEDFDFDFDPSDGITPGQFDFVAVALHEIAHILGFISSVDFVDLFTGAGDLRQEAIQQGLLDGQTVAEVDADLDQQINDVVRLSILDLFRFSDASLAVGSDVRDLSILGTEERFFTLDGGVTRIGFSTGSANGDGSGASHWIQGTGLLDPFINNGSILGGLSVEDLIAFDAIGWDVTTVPEPASGALLLLGVPFFFKRKKNIS